MAGNNRQKKSSFPFVHFNVFKGKRSRKVEDVWDDSVKAYRVFPSDQDNRSCVAKPDIDLRATIFIDKFRSQLYEKKTEHPTAAVSN